MLAIQVTHLTSMFIMVQEHTFEGNKLLCYNLFKVKKDNQE